MDNQPNVNDLEALVGGEMKQADLDAAVERLSKLPEPTHYSLILGLRRIKQGPFSGLWELTQLEGDVSVKRVIMDASTRASVISLATREIGKAV